MSSTVEAIGPLIRTGEADIHPLLLLGATLLPPPPPSPSNHRASLSLSETLDASVS